jgi:hypothetical protein
MDEPRIDDIPQVSDDANALHTAPYTTEKVKKVGFQHNKAPGPHDF